MSWLTNMIEKPAFTNSKDFEYQVRRNCLIPEAEEIADDFCGVEPPNTDVVDYLKYTNKHQRKYYRTMDMLWNQAYPNEGVRI